MNYPQAMAHPILDQAWPAPLVPPVPHAELEARLRKAIGKSPAILPYIAPVSWFHELFYASFVLPPVQIPARWADLVMFTTIQENCCRVCYGAQRAVMRIMGYRNDWIDRLEQDVQGAQLDEREKALVEFSRGLARSNPRPAAKERRKLEALGIHPAQSAEIAVLVAVACCGNRFSTLLSTPPEHGLEKISQAWWGGLLRRIIARQFRKKKAPPETDAATLDGLFGSLLQEIEGLAWAPVLRHTLDGMLAGGVLSARAKLLMIAVVGRAMGCRTCAGEVENALADFGLTAGEVDKILTNLASDKLEPVERALVPFARETVRYRPEAIQRLVRDLVETIGPEATREAVAVAGVANMMARLGMLVE